MTDQQAKAHLNTSDAASEITRQMEVILANENSSQEAKAMARIARSYAQHAKFYAEKAIKGKVGYCGGFAIMFQTSN
jgi:hypothetical protein